MREVCSLIWLALVGAFRSRASLEAENTILRHQLNVLRRQSPKRPTFGMLDRLIFAGLYRLAPKVLGALAIVKPETVIKWHRAGFRLYWRWRSRRRGGRPTWWTMQSSRVVRRAEEAKTPSGTACNWRGYASESHRLFAEN